jgi:RNA-directed DNA polymerase
MRQKNQVELNLGTGASGEAASAAVQETEARAARTDIESRAALVGPSMEVIVERENLKKALAQVKRDKGAPGIDGMRVDGLAAYLKEHWPTIGAQLLDGTYKPQPVRRVEIPKATGGTRPLGVPTVLDRFIQQAVMQVLQTDWDPTFSEASFGFRPERSAHQAVARAQEWIASGHDTVVDIDLEKFFDRVNHDILMGLVAKRVSDKRILKLIRGFLTAGVLADGLIGPTEEGTPQGGPLALRTQKITLRGGQCRVRAAGWRAVARCYGQRDAVADDDLVIADEDFLDEKPQDALAFQYVEDPRRRPQSRKEGGQRFSEAQIGCAVD